MLPFLVVVVVYLVARVTHAQTCQANLLDCPSAGAEGTLFEICGVANLADNATTVNVGTGATVVNLGPVETLTSNDPYFAGTHSANLGNDVIVSFGEVSNLPVGSAVTLGYDTDTGRFYPGKLGNYYVGVSVLYGLVGTGTATLRILLNGVMVARTLNYEEDEGISVTAIVQIMDASDYITVDSQNKNPVVDNAPFQFGAVMIYRIPNT